MLIAQRKSFDFNFRDLTFYKGKNFNEYLYSWSTSGRSSHRRLRKKETYFFTRIKQ
jgi:hypothetical protein